MTAQDILQIISGMSIGTVIAWISVFALGCSFVSGLAIHVYKIFCKYKNYQDDNQHLRDQVSNLEKNQSEIVTKLEYLCQSLDEQKDVNLRQLRYSIVHVCDEAITANCITAGKFRSLIEMYEEYINVFHGNSYAKTLVERVKQLEIVGSLDD